MMPDPNAMLHSLSLHQEIFDMFDPAWNLVAFPRSEEYQGLLE